MEVKYIIDTRYANGDKFADKVDTLEEVASYVLFIDSELNATRDDDNRLLKTQLSITTEEQ